MPTVKLNFATDCRTREHALPAGWRALGGASLGAGGGAEAGAAPCQELSVPLLGTRQPAVHEQWLCDGDCRDGEVAGIRFRRTGNVLYGVLVADEADFPGPAPLRAASEDAYRRIFALLDGEGLPHLWRVWNYLADINGDQDGLERYRQFNVGRQDAFLACDRLASGNVPAACAIGLAGGPLRIAFLAGSDRAFPIENPRQVSAYNYPSDYGPRSPTFSRAALVAPGGQVVFFVSGTASIVGHQTLHGGDAAAQTRESLANIEAVVAEANHCLPEQPFSLDALSYRAYIRHAADFPTVLGVLRATLGDAEIVCLQADICRADLLVEIEAVAVQPAREV